MDRPATAEIPNDVRAVAGAVPAAQSADAANVAPHAAAVAAAVGAVAEQRTRRPIEGHDTRCATTVHGGTAVFLGAAFMALGTLVVAAAFDLILVSEKAVNAPRAVVASIGIAFACVGAWLLVTGVYGIARARRTARTSVLHPSEPWRYDRAWGPDGEDAPRWLRVVQPAVGTLVFGGFAAFAVRCVAMTPGAGWLSQGAVGLFALSALLPLWETIRRAAQAVRHGRTYVRWEGVPLRVGARATIRFGVTRDLPRFERVVFRLRCIEEVFETRAGSRPADRTTTVAAYAWFEEERVVQSPGDLPRQFRDAAVTFDLPSDVPGTHLAAVPPTYWLLEVEGDAPGLDYRERFLVPVYERE